MSEQQKKPLGFIDRARLAIANVLKPKAYVGTWDSARYSPHRSRIDAPMPTDFRQEMTANVRREMVRLSRWLEKNNGLFRQTIKDTALYSVGEGIHMQANGGDFDWQGLVEAEWEQECESPEVTGRFSMIESLYIICESLDRDGEIFAIKAKRNGIPKFQIIECHRVETPPNLGADVNVSDGIRYNKFGVPTVYYVKQSDGSYSGIPASSMMHIYEPTHASASRAYPPHQHAINNMRDEMDLLSMEKVAAKDNARVSRIFKTHDTSADNGDIGLGQALGTSSTDTSNLDRVLGGVTAIIQPNEELVAHQPARPTTAFTGFIEHLRRDSVMGSLPYEFVADPTKAGGSAVRLVVAKASRYFSKRQNIMIKRFLNPYFQYWLGTKIMRGDLPSAKNWWKVDWMVTRNVTVDAGRDAQNERADLEMGRNTLEDDFAARGLQFEKTMRKRAKNFLFLKKLAEDTGLDREDLFRFSPQGGGPSPSEMGKPLIGPDGKPVIGPDGQPVMQQGMSADEGIEMQDDLVGANQPETPEPNIGSGIGAINETNMNFESVPKQNQGLSAPRDESYLR
jgi:capsid protein